MKLYQRFCGCIVQKITVLPKTDSYYTINIYTCSKHKDNHHTWIINDNGIEFKKIKEKDLPPEAIAQMMVRRMRE